MAGNQGIKLKSVGEQMIARYLLNRVTGVVLPAIVIGTSSAADIKVVGATTYMTLGIPRTALTPAEIDLSVLADAGSLEHLLDAVKSQGCYLLIHVATGGTISVTQGPVLTLGERNGVVFDSGETLAELKIRAEHPQVPTGVAVLGDCWRETAPTGTFTFGTTLLSDATDALYRDIFWPDFGPDAFDLTAALA